MTNVVLKIDGQNYAGWKSVNIISGIRRFADTFELSLTDRWSEQSIPRPIKPDSPCELTINDELAMTGYVDDVIPDYDRDQFQLTIIGRSKTSDLIDCSGQQKTFVDATLSEIAKSLCQPLGIEVIVQTDEGQPFSKVILETGERYQEFISRLAAYRGVHVTCNNNGQLVITNTGTNTLTTELVLGENILRCQGTDTKRDRFHTYIVTGQSPATDVFAETDAAQITETAEDQNIRPARTIAITPDDLNLNDAKNIAEYERNIRFGESQMRTYTVADWHHSNTLWQKNNLIKVTDPLSGVNGTRLITEVAFLLNEEGVFTELQVMPKEALQLIALPEPTQDEAIF